MRAIHACAAVFQLAAVAFFAWVYSFSGDPICLLMIGWFLWFGALSTRALRRRGLEA